MYDAFSQGVTTKTEYPIFVVTGFYGVGKTTFGAQMVSQAAKLAKQSAAGLTGQRADEQKMLQKVLERRVHLFLDMMGEDEYCDPDAELQRDGYKEGPLLMRLIAKGIYGCSVQTFREKYPERARLRYDMALVLWAIARAQRKLRGWEEGDVVTVVVQMDEFQVACDMHLLLRSCAPIADYFVSW